MNHADLSGGQDSKFARNCKRYLEECASFCPHCEGEIRRIRRVVSYARFKHHDEARPELVVGCYCAKCGGEWHEYYRLETISIRLREDDTR